MWAWRFVRDANPTGRHADQQSFESIE